MADRIQVLEDQQDSVAFMNTSRDMHISPKMSFSEPLQNEHSTESYFKSSALDDQTLELFNGDLKAIEQFPEECLAGLPFRTPPSSSSSSSDLNSAYHLDASKQITLTGLREPTYTLAYRPAEIPHWDFAQPQHHAQQSLPPSGTSILCNGGPYTQMPLNAHSAEATSCVDYDLSFGDEFSLPTYNPWQMNAAHNAYEYTQPLTVKAMDDVDTTEGDEEIVSIVDGIDLSYAKELGRCLKRMPEYTLSLKDIYAWIRDNTTKVKDPNSKGWQNSVRHNLSLNPAFEKVQGPGNGAKRGGTGLWRLTHEALTYGVQSTTKFRKPAANKTVRKNENPAPQRQASGQKGGLATRNNNRNRKQQERLRQTTSAPTKYHDPQLNLDGTHYGSPYSFASSASSPAFSPVSPPDLPLFHSHEWNHSMAMPVTQGHSHVPIYSTGYGPVHSAIGQYHMQHINHTNVGSFRHFDTVSSPLPVTTPEMTDDSAGSFCMTPSSREQSVA